MAGALRCELDTLIVAPHSAGCNWPMSTTPCPCLSPEKREQISVDQYGVDKKFWNLLKIHFITSGSGLSGILNIFPEPDPPKQPIKLLEILKRYAIALFQCEDGHYPKGAADLDSWRRDLANRTEKMIEKKVMRLEKDVHLSLRFHAPIDQMIEAVRDALKAHIDTLPRPSAVRLALIFPVPVLSTDNAAKEGENCPSPGQLSGIVKSPSAARRLEEHLRRHPALGLSKFATLVPTTDRTIRSFRKTGKVRRDIFEGIAKAMGVTVDDLLKE
jgi:hypothetical protein